MPRTGNVLDIAAIASGLSVCEDSALRPHQYQKKNAAIATSNNSDSAGAIQTGSDFPRE
jgi:hypothetical protein